MRFQLADDDHAAPSSRAEDSLHQQSVGRRLPNLATKRNGAADLAENITGLPCLKNRGLRSTCEYENGPPS